MNAQTRDTKERHGASEAAAPRGVLVVFAKEPQPGFVKTRLTPPLSPEQAAEFYRCMLRDVLETSAQICKTLNLAPVLALHSNAPQILHSQIDTTPFRVIQQRGRNLAERMQNALLDTTTTAIAPSILIFRGSDSPALTLEIFEAALKKLETTDVALSPDRDGGYNLIAMRLSTATKNHPPQINHPHASQDLGQPRSVPHALSGMERGWPKSISHGLSDPERACSGSFVLGLSNSKEVGPGSLPHGLTDTEKSWIESSLHRLQKLFAIEMSTANVLEETLAQAARLGLTAQLLEASFDLDRIEDLRELKNLHDSTKMAVCPRTLAYVEQNNLWRFLDGR